MRPFEILLVLLCFTDGALRLRIPHRPPTWTTTLPLATFLVAIVHLAAEGPRWQMWPAYVAVLAAFALALHRAFTDRIPVRPTPRTTGVLILLLTTASLVASTALPAFDLPPPSGHYVVGVRDVTLPGSDIIVRVRYPADEAVGDPADYAHGHLDRRVDHLASAYGIPAPLLSHLSRVRTHGYPASDLSRELPRYRVLIACPHPDRPPSRYTALLQELASRGFVVVSVLDTSAYHSTEEEASSPDAGLIEAVATGLETLAPEGDAGWLADRLDLARIGVYGIGAPARTALEVCRGSTFRAGAAVDDLPVSTDPVVPFLYLRPEGDTPASPSHLAEPAEFAEFAEFAETTYTVTVRGVRPGNFIDDAFISPLMPALGDFGSIDPYRAHHITGAYLGAFFNKHLTRGTVEPILDGSSRDYPEVAIRIHDPEE